MRGLLLSIAFVPMAAEAEVFSVNSKPNSVILHPGAAFVTREISLDLPAGRHQIRLSDLPDLFEESLNIEGMSGATLEARSFRDSPLLTDALLSDTPEAQKALAAMQAAQSALAAHDELVLVQDAKAEAAQAQISFLEGLKVEEMDAAQLRALGQAIAEDGTAARNAIIESQSEVRRLAPLRKPLEDAVVLAKQAYEKVARPVDRLSELELSVNVAAAGQVSFSLEYYVQAGWLPSYRMYLDADTEVLTVERDVVIEQFSGENWSEVVLQVTSIEAGGQTQPTSLRPRQLRIEDDFARKQRLSVSSDLYSSEMERAPAEPIIEAPVIVEESSSVAGFAGAGVVYSFDVPVTVANNESTTVALSPLSFDVTTTARAVPSYDETAFRMLDFVNVSGERVLTGYAMAFVDGSLVGRLELDTIEPGEDVDLPFGPLHGVQIRRATLDRKEGDRGIISRSNQEENIIRIVVENLTEKAWDTTLVDRVPYSEQEDLEIDWEARPAPTRENVEDKRGILEWDFELAAGTTRQIQMVTDIRWPEGKVLR